MKMKIRELIFISLASFVISASAVEPQRFTVRGNIEDIPDGVVLNLYEENGNLLTTVGQDTVSDGSFCITDTISSPTKSLFLSSDTPGFPNWLAKIIVAPGSVTTVTGKGFLHPLWRYTSDIPRQ
ncbi:MAG: DUF4369 domain-containing protein, partial [Muribaculaceae bacterium]|nr:DUF4369 domain-containing protein [Muribaculaceae bacterium]